MSKSSPPRHIRKTALSVARDVVHIPYAGDEKQNKQDLQQIHTERVSATVSNLTP